MGGRRLEEAFTVRTGARLHFGLLSFGDTVGRQFGGLGAMIDRPGFELFAEVAKHDQIDAPADWISRLTGLLRKCRDHGNATPPGVPLRLQLRRAPPAHSGFGSGTQLGLAVARVVAKVVGEEHVPSTELARRSGRGNRSAIGVHGFEVGGLLLEAGKRTSDAISPLVARVAIPEEWRFALIRPLGKPGISGTQEVAAFKNLPPMPEATTDRLCNLAVRELIPAALESDIDRFAVSLWEFGTLVGRYFAPVQGGVFAHPQMEALAGRLRREGYPGVAQTSWGPTVSVICRDEEQADRLMNWLRSDPTAAECDFLVARGLNHGAT
ncbi:MAG: beta-RFAP synthase [Planctomycetota bacterium]|nr:beta-RFAP synthase [Planctomycetota bacterium]